MASLISAQSDTADYQITADREEVKYEVDADAVGGLVEALSLRLPMHRYYEDGESPLPGAIHYVTTTYFDTEAREAFQRASTSDDNVKLRAKEYYDLHPDLVDAQAGRGDVVRGTDTLWLEIKRRQGLRTRKRRLGMPKSDAPDFFASGAVTAAMLEIQLRLYGEDVGTALEDLHALPGSFSTPLRPDSMVNYRRRAWQSESAALRVTLDSEIAFYRPPNDLWVGGKPLTRDGLGEPVEATDTLVLEIKYNDGVPDWLQTLLDGPGFARSSHSKFLSASRAVHEVARPT
jgi:hypothetical protein